MTATVPDVTLDVDLDKEVPCDGDACLRPATWLVTSHHPGRPCRSAMACEPCRESTQAYWRAHHDIGAPVLHCGTHGQDYTDLTWRRL